MRRSARPTKPSCAPNPAPGSTSWSARPRPDSDRLDIVASAGPTANNARRLQVYTTEAYPEGRGVCGTAYRTRRASLSNDFANDPRGAAFKQVIQADGARSGAAFPLLVDDQCAGVMLFISSEI